MKNLIFNTLLKRLVFLGTMLAAFISPAQEKQKEVREVTFKVAGNCKECKERIENAADIKGVKIAVWDAKTQTLKVTYRTDKVSEEQIKTAILNAGHDIEGEKASDNSYQKLPECCRYRDKKCAK